MLNAATTSEPLIPAHGGYRKLKSFQVAQLVFDITVRFCDRYIDRFSRTRDQMVQAARSGVQNIAEGSQASGTSKKTELKLTSVARASLEELRLDYEDFLRQHNTHIWERSDPRRQCRPGLAGGRLQPARPPTRRPGSSIRARGRLHRATLPHALRKTLVPPLHQVHPVTQAVAC